MYTSRFVFHPLITYFSQYHLFFHSENLIQKQKNGSSYQISRDIFGINPVIAMLNTGWQFAEEFSRK